MAIRFKHDFASMASAFGGGDSQRRGRKYAMDMLAQQQQARQRRPILLEQPEGQWSDPLAITQQPEMGRLASPEDRQAAVTSRAQQKARARKYRLGEAIPDAWQPKFTPQSEIDALQKREADTAAQQQEEADDAWDFHLKGIDEQIPAIPEHLAGTEWESDLRKINEAERKARGDRSLSEDQRAEAVARIQEQRNSLLKGAPPATTPMDDWNKGLRYMGPDGMVYDKRGEGDGWVPGHIRNGEFTETPQSIAQREQKKEDAAAQAKTAQEAAAAQAKAEAERQKQRDAIQDKIDALDDEIATLEDDEEMEYPKTIETKRKRREALAKKLESIPSGFVPAQPVASPATTAPSQIAPASPPVAAPPVTAAPAVVAPVVAPAIAPPPDMTANRDAPVSAPAPPMRARGSRNYGQPIQNYQPRDEAEQNLMTKGYARVPILNAQGRQTGQYSWIPPGTQSPDMLANRQAPVNAPTPPALPTQWPTELSAQEEEDLFGAPASAATAPQSPEMLANRNAPVSAPTPPTVGAGSSSAMAQGPGSPAPRATNAPPSPQTTVKAQQLGMQPDSPPEAIAEAEWLGNLFATKGGPSNWSAEERARYQQNRQLLARYNVSNQ